MKTTITLCTISRTCVFRRRQLALPEAGRQALQRPACACASTTLLADCHAARAARRRALRAELAAHLRREKAMHQLVPTLRLAAAGFGRTPQACLHPTCPTHTKRCVSPMLVVSLPLPQTPAMRGSGTALFSVSLVSCCQLASGASLYSEAAADHARRAAQPARARAPAPAAACSWFAPRTSASAQLVARRGTLAPHGSSACSGGVLPRQLHATGAAFLTATRLLPACCEKHARLLHDPTRPNPRNSNHQATAPGPARTPGARAARALHGASARARA